MKGDGGRIDEIRDTVAAGKVPDADDILWLCDRAELITAFIHADECDPMLVQETESRARRLIGKLAFSPQNEVRCVPQGDMPTLDEIAFDAARHVADPNFIILSGKTAGIAENHVAFAKSRPTPHPLKIRPIGTVGKITIYVDPLLVDYVAVVGRAKKGTIKHRNSVWRLPFDLVEYEWNVPELLSSSVAVRID